MDLSPLFLLLGIKIINTIWCSKYNNMKYFLEPPNEHDINDAINNYRVESKNIVDVKPEFKPYLMNYRFFC
tara:strand:- start:49 stop:261 length:213 start_codon:yes stop_codon:yes gene_type:complete